MDPDGDLGPFVTADELISRRIDGTDFLDKKMAALAAHRSQVATDGPFFAGAESGALVVGRGVLPDRQGHARAGRRRRLRDGPVRRALTEAFHWCDTREVPDLAALDPTIDG